MVENTTSSFNLSAYNGSDLSENGQPKAVVAKLLQITSDLYLMVGILTVIMNGAVVVCFVMNPSQLLKDGYHTLGMSVSDTLAGITVCIYFAAIGRTMSYEMCAFANVAFVSSQCAVIIQLMVICIERFNTMRQVGSAKTMTKFQHPLVIVVVWLFCIIMHLWPVFVHGIRRSDMVVCTFQVIFNQNFGKVGVYYAALYSAPLGMINLFYICALIYLRHRFKKIGDIPENRNNVRANAAYDSHQGSKATVKCFGGQVTELSGAASSTNGNNSKHVSYKHPVYTDTQTSKGNYHRNIPTATTSVASGDQTYKHPVYTDNQTSKGNYHRNIPTATTSVASGDQTGIYSGVSVRFKQSRKQLQRHIFITFGLLLMTLNIVSLPRFGLIFMSKQSSEFLDNMRLAMASFNSLNSFFNPVIYAFRWEALRSVVQEQWAKLKRFFRRSNT